MVKLTISNFSVVFFQRKEKKNRKCSPEAAKIGRKTPKQANCFEVEGLCNIHYFSSSSQCITSIFIR